MKFFSLCSLCPLCPLISVIEFEGMCSMGFASGSVSFRRFAVIGKSPSAVDQGMLDKLAEHALRPQEIGVPEEIEYGWSGGRHVLDEQFSLEHNVFAETL